MDKIELGQKLLKGIGIFVAVVVTFFVAIACSVILAIGVLELLVVIEKNNNILDDEIQNIDFDTTKKVSDLIEGQWDTVCILVRYSFKIEGDSHETTKNINKKISQDIANAMVNKDILIDRSHWHLVLKNPQKTTFLSSRMNYEIFEIKQMNFEKHFKDQFVKTGFTPLQCADFDRAYFFKHKYKNENPVLTLGETSP